MDRSQDDDQWSALVLAAVKFGSASRELVNITLLAHYITSSISFDELVSCRNVLFNTWQFCAKL
jgi:hypothetical protein